MDRNEIADKLEESARRSKMNKCSSVYIPDEEVYTECKYDKDFKCKDPYYCETCYLKYEYDKEPGEQEEEISMSIFALRYDNKIYEFKLPMDLFITKIKKGYINHTTAYLMRYVKSYDEIIKDLAEEIHYTYNRFLDNKIICTKELRDRFMNNIIVREI